eukprot:g4025.t1
MAPQGQVPNHYIVSIGDRAYTVLPLKDCSWEPGASSLGHDLWNHIVEVPEGWEDSTDVTLLNSPALRRPTGRHLRSLWLCMHLLLWSSICSSDLLHSRTSQSSGDQIGGRCLGEVPSYGAAALIPSISARALMLGVRRAADVVGRAI